MCCMQKKNQTGQTWKIHVRDKLATRENGGLLSFPRMDCEKKDMHDDMACDINTDSVRTGETAPGSNRNPDANPQLRQMMREAMNGWLWRIPSKHTRMNDRRAVIDIETPEQLVHVGCSRARSTTPAIGPVAISACQWLPWILTTACHDVYRRRSRHEICGRAGLDAPVNLHSLQATALTATRNVALTSLNYETSRAMPTRARP